MLKNLDQVVKNILVVFTGAMTVEKDDENIFQKERENLEKNYGKVGFRRLLTRERLGFTYNIKNKEENDILLNKLKKEATENPNDDTTWADWGMELIELGRYSDAIEKISKVVEIDHRNVDWLIVWGDAFVGEKQFDKAIEQYSKALEINPNNGDAWIHWAKAVNISKFDESGHGYAETTKILALGSEINPGNNELLHEWDTILEVWGGVFSFTMGNQTCRWSSVPDPENLKLAMQVRQDARERRKSLGF